MARVEHLLHDVFHAALDWQRLLDYYLARAGAFRAYFPAEPDLSEGEAEFRTLPGVTDSPWDGMADCRIVSGPLGPGARALFSQACPDQDGYGSPRLWQFELLVDGEVALRLEDFTVGFVLATPAELEALAALGVDTSRLEPLPQPTTREEYQVKPIEDEDPEHLHDALFKRKEELEED